MAAPKPCTQGGANHLGPEQRGHIYEVTVGHFRVTYQQLKCGTCGNVTGTDTLRSVKLN